MLHRQPERGPYRIRRSCSRRSLRGARFKVVEVFEDEGVSGFDAVEKRPDFSRMLSRARVGAHKQQGVSCILVYDISR